MNLPDFLQEVDRVTATCSQEQLAATILELARNLPEGQRAGFLRTVRAGARRRAKKAVAGPDDVRKELEKACQESMKRLEQIEGKELALTVRINQDLRTRPREEFRYGDPQGVLKILGKLPG